MSRGNNTSSGMATDGYAIIQWLEHNVAKLDDSSKIMKNTLGELKTSEVFQSEHSLCRLCEELCEILIPCLDGIEHAKYVMDKAVTHYKELNKIINCTGLCPWLIDNEVKK